MKKNLVAVVAATIVAGLLVSPADARPKKQKRPDAQRSSSSADRAGFMCGRRASTISSGNCMPP